MSIKVNDTDLKTLSLFTKGYNKDHYIREIEKLLKVSSRTALITLDKLEKIGILESKKRGKTKLYSIKKSIISREFFLLTEQYKKIQFFQKNTLIKEILEKADNYMKGIVIIFGSYVKGIQKDNSDLDILIVGKYDEKQIKKIGDIYGISISIKSYPKNIFKKELDEDILLKEIVENHIIIKGGEEFVRRVLKWIK